MRITLRVVILLFSIVLFGLNTPAQVCGNGFVQVTISDASGKAISGAAIEIIAAFPPDWVKPDFYKFDANPPWMKYVESFKSGEYWTLRRKNIKKFLKLTVAPDRAQDMCGNPLKQQLGVTPVKGKRSGSLTDYAGKPNFGYCTGEVLSILYTLKISAPGYRDSYFLGNFLGGCDRPLTFILKSRKRVKTKKPLRNARFRAVER